MDAKEQRQVAVDAFLLQHFGGANPFPRGCDLDEDVIAADSCVVVLLDDGAGHLDCGVGVVGQAGIDFSRDAAGNDGQNLLSEGHSEALEGEVGNGLVGGAPTQFIARVLKNAIDNGLILRHLRRCCNQRRVGSGILGMELLHCLHIAGIGHDHGVITQLFQ